MYKDQHAQHEEGSEDRFLEAEAQRPEASFQGTVERGVRSGVRGSASWWPVPRVQCFSMVLWKCGAGSSTIITFVPRSLRAPKCDTLMMLGLRQNSKLASSNHHGEYPRTASSGKTDRKISLTILGSGFSIPDLRIRF